MNRSCWAEKTILVTNDDGIGSAGLLHLVKVLSGIARVIVVAPLRDMSNCSHSFYSGVEKRMYLRKIGDNVQEIVVDATPAESAYIGLSFMDQLSNIVVVSGINNGYNMADDILYSGTVAAAREAALHGVPSIAVSASDFNISTLEVASKTVSSLILDIFQGKVVFRNGDFVNINIPPSGGTQKVTPTRIGRRPYSRHIVVDSHRDGFMAVTPHGSQGIEMSKDGTDIFETYVKKNISVTLLNCVGGVPFGWGRYSPSNLIVSV